MSPFDAHGRRHATISKRHPRNQRFLKTHLTEDWGTSNWQLSRTYDSSRFRSARRWSLSIRRVHRPRKFDRSAGLLHISVRGLQSLVWAGGTRGVARRIFISYPEHMSISVMTAPPLPPPRSKFDQIRTHPEFPVGTQNTSRFL